MSKVIQFTITERCYKILTDFANKYGTSKSIVVNKAIEHLAGQYHKKLIISYELASDNVEKQEIKNNTTEDPDMLLTDEEYREVYLKRLEEARTRTR